MKFKSWYLVLIGILFQAVFGLVMIFKADDIDGIGGIGFAIGGILLLIAASLGIIPLLLLIFHKTRKVGAITSILFGVFGMVIRLGIIVGIFMLIAGVFSLSRKK